MSKVKIRTREANGDEKTPQLWHVTLAIVCSSLFDKVMKHDFVSNCSWHILSRFLEYASLRSGPLFEQNVDIIKVI
jgi:hypothetical protein